MTAKFVLFSFAQPIIPIFGEHAEMTSVRAFVFRIFSSLFGSLKARPNLRRVGFNSENFAINCEIWAFFFQKFRSSTRNLTIFSGFFLGYQFWPLFFDAKKKKAARLIHITSEVGLPVCAENLAWIEKAYCFPLFPWLGWYGGFLINITRIVHLFFQPFVFLGILWFLHILLIW